MGVNTERAKSINDQPEADRRIDVRRRVFKGATVSFNRGFSTFECVVRNQSETGASLSFGETFALPSRFSIAISNEEARDAEVRWRSLSQVGISFV